jgi:hypothetical protein
MEVKKAPKNWSIIKYPMMVDPSPLFEPIPWERGLIRYNNPGSVEFETDELQVTNSLGRYNHPKFKKLHHIIKQKVEEIIDEKLYSTYYYDRFYFKNQALTVHRDRPSCEVSVSFHIKCNLDYKWPLYFLPIHESEGRIHQPDPKIPRDAPIEMTCFPGDAIIYRGMDLWHWREPMKGNHESYYHQIFFHYVRANGPYVQYAGDAACGM